MRSTRTRSRLDWRDPDMLVCALNGQDIGLGYRMGDVTKEFMQYASEQSLDYPDPRRPNWRNDPTYNLRKKDGRRTNR